MSYSSAGGGGSIKSVQRGTLNASNSAINTAINTVDESKATLKCWAALGASSGTGSVVEAVYPVVITATEIQWPAYTTRKPTVLSFEATPSILAATGTVALIYWELTEYA